MQTLITTDNGNTYLVYNRFANVAVICDHGVYTVVRDLDVAISIFLSR